MLSIDEEAQYIKNKGFDEEAYIKWIISYLETYKAATKSELVKLLEDKLPDTLDEKQKERKVRYLLQKMSSAHMITTDGDNKRLAKWILAK